MPARLAAEQGWAAQHRSVGSARKGGFLTSLGGSPENSSYKGYGLAVMVNILGSCLSSATLITDPMYTKNLTVMTLGIV
jgi:LDH2 family malate/lactate/ureidoglycolate dehydrogenase